MNESIFFFFYNLAHISNIFDNIVIFFAVSLIYVVIISALLFSYFYRKSWREFFLVLFSGGVTWFLAKFVAKILFHTLRPFVIFPQVHSLFAETGYAFPSGHTAVAAAVAFAVFFINKKYGYVFMLLALLIGLARVTAGVHFPIDILGGFALGASVAWLIKFKIAYLMQKIKKVL
ncbi:MAG: phosphatase PAP2 family protein [bacterium]